MATAMERPQPAACWTTPAPRSSGRSSDRWPPGLGKRPARYSWRPWERTPSPCVRWRPSNLPARWPAGGRFPFDASPRAGPRPSANCRRAINASSPVPQAKLATPATLQPPLAVSDEEVEKLLAAGNFHALAEIGPTVVDVVERLAIQSQVDLARARLPRRLAPPQRDIFLLGPYAGRRPRTTAAGGGRTCCGGRQAAFGPACRRPLVRASDRRDRCGRLARRPGCPPRRRQRNRRSAWPDWPWGKAAERSAAGPASTLRPIPIRPTRFFSCPC